MMCAHGAAVVRGSWHAVVAIDMPFGSYEASPQQAFASAARVLKETGAAAVKLEGGEAMAETIAFLAARGIPVIGHVGLTPQAVNALGGYRRPRQERGGGRRRSSPTPAPSRRRAASLLVIEGVMEEIAAEATQDGRLPDDRHRRLGRAATARCSSPRTCSACSSAPRAS